MSADITTHAIVLRRRDSGESDRRLTLFTQEFGVIETVAKGARKGGSRLAGVTEPLTVGTFQMAKGKARSYITQVQPLTSFPKLRSDYDRMLLALAIAELAAVILPHEERSDDSFRFVLQAIHYLEIAENALAAFLWAECKLMAIAGFQPSWTECVVTGQTISENPAWVSPQAGGYVALGSETGFSDRFAAPAEALIAAEKIQELDIPPASVKFLSESVRLVIRFWMTFADDPLPTHRAVMDQLLASNSGA